MRLGRPRHYASYADLVWRRVGWRPPSRRMDAEPQYYVLALAVGTVVGAAGQRAGRLRWWTVTIPIFFAAWAFPWLTAVRDWRHPFQSVRMALLEARGPLGATFAELELIGLPLFAPPADWPGTARPSGQARRATLQIDAAPIEATLLDLAGSADWVAQAHLERNRTLTLVSRGLPVEDIDLVTTPPRHL